MPDVVVPIPIGTIKRWGSSDLPQGDEPAYYQLVGEVMAHQG